RNAGARGALPAARGRERRLELDLSRVEPARRLFAEALEVIRAVGERHSEGTTLGYMASLCRETGQLRGAEVLYLEALAIHRETQNVRLEGQALMMLARLRLARGRIDGARSAWREAAVVVRKAGGPAELARRTREMQAECAAAGVDGVV
ncbi:MAG: tetratricopeptide repeat protein, partial [Candidatus Brocadiae bacterium]|nr:tetratricopeptide repeat protein [Candidatus Brocadiia bacterium]